MPLIVDPDLQAQVIRQFNLRGELAPFNLTENVVPVFDIGSLTGNLPTVVTTLAGAQGVRVGTTAATTFLPVGPVRYDDQNIFTSGPVVNPGAGAVIIDTGQLGSFPHLVHWQVNNSAALAVDFEVQWRDAANAVTLANWPILAEGGAGHVEMMQQLVLSFQNLERLRIITPVAVVGTVNCMVAAQSMTRSAAQ